MENKIKIFLLISILYGFAVNAGEQLMYSLAINPHIKLINYNQDNIHRYDGFYGYQSSIVFEHDEVINTISMGVSTGWQLEPQGNRLFIKPVEDNADTNATIITNKRVYLFNFHAREAEGIHDPEIAYEVRFQYPTNDITITNDFGMDDIASNDSEIPDIASASNINFNYTVSGADYIKPIKAFDDGRFTYLEFNSENAELPAIFVVDSEGYESLVNFRVRGDYVIIERVDAKFTLRNGRDSVCLTNKNIPYYYIDSKKRSIFG